MACMCTFPLWEGAWPVCVPSLCGRGRGLYVYLPSVGGGVACMCTFPLGGVGPTDVRKRGVVYLCPFSLEVGPFPPELLHSGGLDLLLQEVHNLSSCIAIWHTTCR